MESSLANTNDIDGVATWPFGIMFFGMCDDARKVTNYDIGVGTNW